MSALCNTLFPTSQVEPVDPEKCVETVSARTQGIFVVDMWGRCKIQEISQNDFDDELLNFIDVVEAMLETVALYLSIKFARYTGIFLALQVTAMCILLEQSTIW